MYVSKPEINLKKDWSRNNLVLWIRWAEIWMESSSRRWSRSATCLLIMLLIKTIQQRNMFVDHDHPTDILIIVRLWTSRLVRANTEMRLRSVHSYSNPNLKFTTNLHTDFSTSLISVRQRVCKNSSYQRRKETIVSKLVYYLVTAKFSKWKKINRCTMHLI